MRALPACRFEAAGRVEAKVDAGSTIHVRGNTYSVSSRLIGEHVEARFALRALVEVGLIRRRQRERLVIDPSQRSITQVSHV